MLYLANASSPAIRDAIAAGELGMMCTPAEGRSPAIARYWAADNGCFGKGYPGDEKWFAWLVRHAKHADRCLFANAPDVFLPKLGIGDAVATLRRSEPWLPRIRALGYPAGLVFQDGIENLDIPWDSFDVAFIGGSTRWKLGRHAARLITEASRRGKRVHMGRVNSAKRFSYATVVGCDSTDGTFLTFGPDVNLARLRSWRAVPDLFSHRDISARESVASPADQTMALHEAPAANRRPFVEAQPERRELATVCTGSGHGTSHGARRVLTSLRRRGDGRAITGRRAGGAVPFPFLVGAGHRRGRPSG
jgi:hypothetical protein